MAPTPDPTDRPVHCHGDDCTKPAVAKCPICEIRVCEDDGDGPDQDCPNWRCDGVLEALIPGGSYVEEGPR